MGLLSLFIILAISPSFSQVCSSRIFAREVNFGNNLSTNEVWKIKQDKTGYLWICTTDGLARYDGHNVINLRNEYSSPYLFPGDSGCTDCLDGDKYIWIGTRDGLRLLDKNSFEVLVPKDTLLANSNIERLESSKDGIWVVHRNNFVSCCDLDGSLKKNYDLREGSSINRITINNITCDNQGTIWISAGRAGLFYYSPMEDSFKKVDNSPSINYSTLCQDNNNNYWVASYGQGLFYYQPNAALEKQWTKYSIINPENGQEDNSFFCVKQDKHEGYIWLLSFYNLYVIKLQEDGSIVNIDVSNVIDTHSMYTFIHEDREGNLWFSSYGKNAEIVFDEKEIRRFKLNQISSRWGLKATVRDCKIDNDGKIWFNQDRLGLCLFDPKTEELDDVLLSWNLNLANSISRKSAMWVNRNESSIIYLYENKNNRSDRVLTVNLSDTFDECGYVVQMEEDTAGILWVRTENGLFAVNEIGNILSSNLKTMIGTDSRGNIYGVDENGQIYRLFVRQGNIQEVAEHAGFTFVDKEEPRFVTVDNSDGVWVFTSLGRLFRTNLLDATIKQVTLDGIFDGYNIIGMTSHLGWLYLRSNYQLISYSIKDGNYSVVYSQDENIDMLNFLHNAFDVDEDGNILIGGDGGLAMLKAPVIGDHIWNYSPVITEVSVDDEPVYVQNSEFPDATLRLPPSSVNIGISFSFLYYGMDNAPAISYRMDGVDKEWITVNGWEENRAFYNKLPKGAHNFRLRYEYSSGKWIENSVPLVINRRPHPLDTIWAYALYIILFFGFGALIISILSKRKNLDNQLEELKSLHTRQSFAMGKIAVAKVIDDSKDKFLMKLARVVEDNLTDSEFTSSKMADALGISKSTLVRRIKEYAGMTPFDYIRNVRMKRAAELLIRTKMTISEIAYATGFSNPAYFTRCFKDYYGVTPSEYVSTGDKK